MKRYEFFVALYFTIYHTKIGSIISIGDLPTTNIIEPYFECHSNLFCLDFWYNIIYSQFILIMKVLVFDVSVC